MILATLTVPLTDDHEIIAISKNYLTVLITLFSIIYGFLLNRLIGNYNQLNSLINKSMVYIESLNEKEKGEMATFLKKCLENREQSAENNTCEKISYLSSLTRKQLESELKNIHRPLTDVFNIISLSKESISLGQWITISLLSLIIVSFSFVARENNFLSSYVITVTLCLSVLSCFIVLVEYTKKRNLLIKEYLDVICRTKEK
jgi:hypothetical protein